MSSKSRRRCIMGCQDGQSLHSFPRDVKRRAEWSRILGVYPREKHVYLCGAHIPHYFIQGNRVSRFAVPNAPESRQFIKKCSTSYDDCRPVKIEKEIGNFSEEVTSEEKDIKEEKKCEETQENKIEDFEIRKGNNDMIIKGRFIQTENYLMVSYTPPKKWSLQKQVKLLDEHCTRMLKQIDTMNRQNCLMRNELKSYGKLLPKLRYLEITNRFLYAQLRIYKLKEKAARKRKMERKLKRKHEDNVVT